MMREQILIGYNEGNKSTLIYYNRETRDVKIKVVNIKDLGAIRDKAINTAKLIKKLEGVKGLSILKLNDYTCFIVLDKVGDNEYLCVKQEYKDSWNLVVEVVKVRSVDLVTGTDNVYINPELRFGKEYRSFKTEVGVLKKDVKSAEELRARVLDELGVYIGVAVYSYGDKYEAQKILSIQELDREIDLLDVRDFVENRALYISLERGSKVGLRLGGAEDVCIQREYVGYWYTGEVSEYPEYLAKLINVRAHRVGGVRLLLGKEVKKLTVDSMLDVRDSVIRAEECSELVKLEGYNGRRSDLSECVKLEEIIDCWDYRTDTQKKGNMLELGYYEEVEVQLPRYADIKISHSFVNVDLSGSGGELDISRYRSITGSYIEFRGVTRVVGGVDRLEKSFISTGFEGSLDIDVYDDLEDSFGYYAAYDRDRCVSHSNVGEDSVSLGSIRLHISKESYSKHGDLSSYSVCPCRYPVLFADTTCYSLAVGDANKGTLMLIHRGYTLEVEVEPGLEVNLYIVLSRVLEIHLMSAIKELEVSMGEIEVEDSTVEDWERLQIKGRVSRLKQSGYMYKKVYEYAKGCFKYGVAGSRHIHEIPSGVVKVSDNLYGELVEAGYNIVSKAPRYLVLPRRLSGSLVCGLRNLYVGEGIKTTVCVYKGSATARQLSQREDLRLLEIDSVEDIPKEASYEVNKMYNIVDLPEWCVKSSALVVEYDCLPTIDLRDSIDIVGEMPMEIYTKLIDRVPKTNVMRLDKKMEGLEPYISIVGAAMEKMWGSNLGLVEYVRSKENLYNWEVTGVQTERDSYMMFRGEGKSEVERIGEITIVLRNKTEIVYIGKGDILGLRDVRSSVARLLPGGSIGVKRGVKHIGKIMATGYEGYLGVSIAIESDGWLKILGLRISVDGERLDIDYSRSMAGSLLSTLVKYKIAIMLEGGSYEEYYIDILGSKVYKFETPGVNHVAMRGTLVEVLSMEDFKRLPEVCEDLERVRKYELGALEKHE